MSDPFEDVNIEELTADIQDALDEPSPPGPDEALFLEYLRKELPRLSAAEFEHELVFLSVRDLDGLSLAGSNCRTISIGEKKLPKDTRTHKHGRWDYRFETRSVKKKAYIEFCHPSMGDIWTDVRECAHGAIVTAVVAAVLAENFAVAKATFYPVFYSCLVSKIGRRAREVSVEFRVETEHGCWENHC